jgi:hypothetical protein
MGLVLLNALHQYLFVKTGRSKQDAEQSNLFKAVNTLYDRSSVNVLTITRHHVFVHKSE